MSSQSQFSCGFFCLLWLVGASVLSNLVYIGSFHPKPTQDHKVSICITNHVYEDLLLMYILFARGTHEHEGTFSHIYISYSDAYSQDTCNTLPSLSCLCIHMFFYSIFTWLHTCRGSLCMLHVFPKLYLLFSISLSKALMYVVTNYQIGGDWKSKSSPGDFGN